MDLLAPFLYQFIGGGLLLLAGMFGAVRVGAIDLSSGKDRLWTVLVFGVVAAYFIVQAAFQFIFGAS